jgi:hypothetical protein
MLIKKCGNVMFVVGDFTLLVLLAAGVIFIIIPTLVWLMNKYIYWSIFVFEKLDRLTKQEKE